FLNCEWLNCEVDTPTIFKNCVFKGRFVSLQSRGLRSAVYDPITDSNVDGEARLDSEKLLCKPNLLSTSREAIIGITTALLAEFHPGSFFIPRTREQVDAKLIGPTAVKEKTLVELIARGVLEMNPGRGYEIVKKTSAS